MTLAAVLVAAYLLGSIPTSYIVVYRFTGRDIRTMGSGNPGTMNVLDAVGRVPALLVGTGDISKGMAAVAIAYLAGLGDVAAVLAAIAAVAGHDYSLFLRLHGGNGMAAAIGGLAGLLPLPTVIAATLAAVIWRVTGSRRLAGMIGLASVPVLAYTMQAPDLKMAGAFVLIGFTVLKIFRFEGFSPARSRPSR